MDDEFHVDASLQDIIDRTIREGFFEVLTSTVEQELAVPEDWQGFTGIASLSVDELNRPWEWAPLTEFTPELFDRMWGGFSYEQKIQYVKDLMTRTSTSTSASRVIRSY